MNFLQIPNNIAKMKDSEKSITNQWKFKYQIFYYKKNQFATKFALAIVKSNDKYHYLYKLFLKLIPIALCYSEN